MKKRWTYDQKDRDHRVSLLLQETQYEAFFLQRSNGAKTDYKLLVLTVRENAGKDANNYFSA